MNNLISIAAILVIGQSSFNTDVAKIITNLDSQRKQIEMTVARLSEEERIALKGTTVEKTSNTTVSDDITNAYTHIILAEDYLKRVLNKNPLK